MREGDANVSERMRLHNSALNPLSVLATIGFCGYIFWELLGIFGNLGFISRFLPREQVQYFSLFEFFILAIAFIAAFKAHRKLEEHFGIVVGVGIICTLFALSISLLGYLAPADSIPVFLWIMLWGCHGLSLAGLMFTWALFFSKINDGSTSRAISISYAIGYLLFCLYSIANPSNNGSMSLLVAGIVAALTVLLLIFCYFSRQEPSTVVESEGAPDKQGSKPPPETARPQNPRAVETAPNDLCPVFWAKLWICDTSRQFLRFHCGVDRRIWRLHGKRSRLFRPSSQPAFL